MNKHIPVLAAGALLLVVPQLPLPDFWVTLLDYIGLSTLVAMGLVLLTGVGGMTSFGQAAFVGFGAYTTAVLATNYGVSPWLNLPVSLAVTGVVAWAVGGVTVRLSGHYLPLGTMAWGLSFFFLFGNLQFLGGHDGVNGIPPLNVAGQDLYSPRAYFTIIWLAVLGAVVATTNLLDTRIGRAVRALRAGAVVGEAFGVDTARIKLIVFVYAALLAGLSGWLFAHFQRAVNPTAFSMTVGIEYLFMAVLGGAGHVFGAVVGAGIVTILRDQLQNILPSLIGAQGNYETVVFGLLLVALLQGAREGLWPFVLRLLPPRRIAEVKRDAEPLPGRTMPEEGRPLLEVCGVTKSFGGLIAVSDASFLVGSREIVGLIGPNGAGKSTTFNLITGHAPLSGGQIRFLGRRIDGLPARTITGLGIGRTFQHVEIVADMSVLDNVALGAHIRGRAGVLRGILRLDRGEEARLLAEAARQVERVGLGEYLYRPAGSLALGQLRILEIARALCLDPVLLLLDEPAAGLRHFEKQALAGLLDRLRAEGMSILLVEHDVDFVMNLTNHIAVLDFGKMIAKGVPDEIRCHPAVLEAYLGGVA